MMIAKTKILAWLVVILLATNVSTILSFAYHRYTELKQEPNEEMTQMPGEQRTRFFKEQLGLTPNQVDLFREVNRSFNQQARGITQELEFLRASLVDEMIRETPDHSRLKELSVQIGAKHAQLKTVTYTFYLSLKKLCNDEQKEQLARIFKSLVSADQNIQLPQGKRGKHKRQ
jgi:hypothetical protein